MAAASFVVLAACSDNKPAAPAEPAAVAAKPSDDPAWPSAAVADPTTLGFTAEGLAALDARMAQSVANQDFGGIVTLLMKDGEIAQFKSYGIRNGDPKTGTPMTIDTLFRVYSMTKPVTGVALMQLYEQGKWQLDDPISKFAPELANLKVLTWKDGKPVMKGGKPVLADPTKPPTMRQLMSHTAGFAYGILGGDDPVNTAYRSQNVPTSKNLDEMMTKLTGLPLLYDPGTRWVYSVSVDVQGYLVQKISGQKFGDYLKANIFTPLNMNETSFILPEDKKERLAEVYGWNKDKSALQINPQRNDIASYDATNEMESGGGGLLSTAHDYGRFVQMLVNKGTLAGKTILKPESIAVMAENQIGDLGVFSDGTSGNPGLPGQKFGLDFAIYTDPAAGQHPFGKGTFYWSGIAGTIFWVDPVNNIGFVGMVQSFGGRRPDAMDFRAETGRLIYAALKPTAAAPAAMPAEAAKQPEAVH